MSDTAQEIKKKAGTILAQAHVTASGDYWKALAFDLAQAVMEKPS